MQQHLLKACKAILHLENWSTRLLEDVHLLPKKALVRYKLRRGPAYWVRPYTSDAACLQSITRDQEYFPYFNVLPGDTVVDVGANIGSFSVFVAHREPTAKIVCVEPVQANFAILEKNIAENALTNITPVRAAIADHPGTLTIYHGKGTLHASGSAYAIDATDAGDKEEVPSMTLGALLDAHGIGHVDFLKMDCEGAEYDILFSLPDAVWTRIKKVALEYHNFVAGKNQEDLLSLLQQKGFRTVLPKKYQGKAIGLIFALRP